MERQLDWLKRNVAPFMLLLVGLALAVTLVWAGLNQSETSDESKGSNRSASPAPQVTARSDPPRVQQEKRDIVEVARRCIRAYYKRDIELYSGDDEQTAQRYRDRLAPCATPRFLRVNLRSLDTPADDALASNDGEQRVEYIEFSDGDPATGIHAYVDMVTTQSGTQPVRYSLPVEITLANTSVGWKVDSLDEEF